MQTVSKELWLKTYRIKNSKFETFITQVSSLTAAQDFLAKYSDSKATHNCYAYVVGLSNQVKKFSDDHEPSKSAGFAILKILVDKQLTNIIVLVRRYFQPPKLGIGSLVRGYQQGLLNYLSQINLLSISASKEYQIIVPYTLVSLIYQWQKIYHFLILKQVTNQLKTSFTINLSNEIISLPYHAEVEINFIRESFLISDN